METRSMRIGRLVTGVIAEAIRASGSTALLIVDDGSVEAHLLEQWCARHLAAPFYKVPEDEAAEHDGGDRLLSARGTNKTALLLGRNFPAEPLLPLGDLYATQVRELGGGCSLPPDVQRLAEAAEGIDALDGALQACFEAWQQPERAANQLPAPARGPFLEAVRGGRFWRERAGLIPKLGTRTIGIDLFA
jgi:hypothetical protein